MLTDLGRPGPSGTATVPLLTTATLTVIVIVMQTTDEALASLKEPGARRKKAIAAARRAEAELRPLIGPALAAGATQQMVRDLTGLSINTIKLWAH
jgi:hypothetical protein